MKPIAVIGAGNSGLAMAAHLLSRDCPVHLWNRARDPDPLAPIREAGGIEAQGKVRGRFLPDRMTSDVAAVLDGVDLVMVTVPANAHGAVMEHVAPHLVDGQVVVLNPGRTCGALECRNILRRFGSRADVTLAETQTILYTCRKVGPARVNILTFKRNVLLSALDPSRTALVLERLPDCLRQFLCPAANTLETGLGNVGMILHVAPMLFNIGWIESTRTRFKYYYEGITLSVGAFLENLDSERVAVARACGIETPTVAQWMRRVYGVAGETLFECIKANESYARIDAPSSLQHRYLMEDLPTGLVPLEAIGKALGVPTPLATLIIDLGGHVLGRDVRAEGRNAQALGIASLREPAEVAAAISGAR